MRFLATVSSVRAERELLGSSGQVAGRLVRVECGPTPGGFSASWVCHEQDAPEVGSAVRVDVEAVPW